MEPERNLVLHRDQLAGTRLDHVCPPRQPVSLGIEREVAQDQHASLDARPAFVNSPMAPAATLGVFVLGPDIVDMDQGCLTPAVAVVLEGRDQDDWPIHPSCLTDS